MQNASVLASFLDGRDDVLNSEGGDTLCAESLAQLEQPLHGGLASIVKRGWGGDQPGNRTAVPGNGDLLTPLYAVEQVGQILCLGGYLNVGRGHGGDIGRACGVVYCGGNGATEGQS